MHLSWTHWYGLYVYNMNASQRPDDVFICPAFLLYEWYSLPEPGGGGGGNQGGLWIWKIHMFHWETTKKMIYIFVKQSIYTVRTREMGFHTINCQYLLLNRCPIRPFQNDKCMCLIVENAKYLFIHFYESGSYVLARNISFFTVNVNYHPLP